MASKKKKPFSLTLTKSLSMSSNSTRLLPYLVLGGQESVSDMSTLDLLGITHILNVSNDCKSWFEDKLAYHRVGIEDEPGADASAHFEDAHSFLCQVRERSLAGERVAVMVHCKTGMSRSTTMVLAHLMLTPNMLHSIADFNGKLEMLSDAAQVAANPHRSGPHMTLRDALAYIRERRPRASPNAGFMQQLVELEAKLHSGVVTIDLDKYRRDRFGDVRTFCIGEIDPIAGYTGSSASAINDDALLLNVTKADDSGLAAVEENARNPASEASSIPPKMTFSTADDTTPSISSVPAKSTRNKGAGKYTFDDFLEADEGDVCRESVGVGISTGDAPLN